MAALVRVVTGVRLLAHEAIPGNKPVVFYANHSSHLDAPLIWSALPTLLRRQTRPVAALDYWNRGPLRRWVSTRVLKALLIERKRVSVRNNPVAEFGRALEDGDSLIIFPEGTRSPDGRILPFKSGIFHLARQHPGVPLVPVYLENLSRILPKGELLPVPLIANLFIGETIHLQPEEDKASFLERARGALLQLKRL